MLAELHAAGYDATHISRALPTDYQGGALTTRYDAVVAGLDQEFDYRRLAVAASAIRAGARFVATNADQRYPTPTGFMPGAGAIVAALRTASGSEPLVIGKPGPAMFLAILERAGLTPGEAVVVGDNPDADMVAASRAGIRSILVLTGVTDADGVAELRGERRPDGVVAGPSELAGVLGLDLS